MRERKIGFNKKNENGETPLELARSSDKLRKKLKAQGAKKTGAMKQ